MSPDERIFSWSVIRSTTKGVSIPRHLNELPIAPAEYYGDCAGSVSVLLSENSDRINRFIH